VIVGDMRVVFADGGDEVALHYLHVVDVEEQFEALRADALAELDAPGGSVAHIIRVVAPAVEQFHAEGDPVFLGQRYDALEAQGAVLQTFLLAHASAVAGETDHVRITLPGCNGNGPLEELDDFVM